VWQITPQQYTPYLISLSHITASFRTILKETLQAIRWPKCKTSYLQHDAGKVVESLSFFSFFLLCIGYLEQIAFCKKTTSLFWYSQKGAFLSDRRFCSSAIWLGVIFYLLKKLLCKEKNTILRASIWPV